MKRKILSLILVFAMTVSLLTVGTGAVEPTYGDTAGHWAESSIERWSAYGIIQGSNGQFDPNGQLTCAQLATILAKLLKLPAAKDAGFTDNTADAWYYDAVNRCAAAGILNGNGDGTVTPDAPISRERAMVMLARALGIEPIREPDLTKYSDAAKVAPYAQGMVAAMIEAGIVGGVTADELAPQDNINRASTVTILDRAISTYADKAGATVKADGKGIVLVVADDVTVTGDVDKLLVPADNVDVTVSGSKNIDDITVTGDNSKVILNNSTANDVTLDGKNTELETKSGSKVENVSVTEDAKGATVNAGSGTTIGTVDSKADNVSISGDGKVENASVSGDNTKVNTKDTKVDVDEGVTGTTAGGKEVAGGTTTETKPSTPSGGGPVHSHTWGSWVSNYDGTHTRYYNCGHTGSETADCTFVADVCSVCGYDKNAIYIDTAAEAQAALDNCAPNTTIQLSEGVDYGVLYLRPINGSPATKTVDWQGNDYRWETYTCFENLTIKGAKGATIGAIVIEGGTYYNTAHSQSSTHPIMLSLIELKNVTIKNVTFTGKGGYDPQGYGNVINLSGTNIKVEGLTVDNCVLENADDNARMIYKTENTTQEHVYTYGGQTYKFYPTLKDITLTGCTFNGGYMAVELRETENVTITGNTFNGLSSRNILLPTNSGCTYSGTVTITGNTSDGAVERFVRADQIGNAKLIITGNTIKNYKSSDADYIKVTGATGETTIEDNTLVSVASTEAAQAALDAATEGTVIQLSEGVNYGTVYVGRPTKYNDTVMLCATHSFTTTDDAEFATHLADGQWHTTPKYTTTLKNVTIVGAEGATVAGVLATSGHAYGGVHDYVLDKDVSGSAYYNTLNISNLKFSGVSFTGKIDINTSDATSVYDGVTFEGCTFTTGGTASSNGAAIRYYNENDNGNVKNLTVNDCDFTNCYQGIYVHHVNGVSVTTSTFNGTGHNAIALQGHDGAVNLKTIRISENTFENIKDRVIRFNNIGAESAVTISGNTITNSGDEGREVIKYTTKEDGARINLTGNTWDGCADAALIYNNGVWMLPVVMTANTSDFVAAMQKVPAGVAKITLVDAEGDIGIVIAPDGYSSTITVYSKEGLLYLNTLFDNWVACFTDGSGGEYSNYVPVNGGKGEDYYYSGRWTIVLDADIDLNNDTIAPVAIKHPVSADTPTFNGNNHTIKNAKIVMDATAENAAGLFDASSVAFKDLKLDNIQVTGSNVGNSTAGVLSGSCNFPIDNITITNSSVTGGKYTGGVVGYGYTSITNCTLTNVTVKGGYKLGGIIGYICASGKNTGDVTGNTLTGCTVDGIGGGVFAGGKDKYIIGKVVGNYNCNGTCNNNTITGMTTSATANIGEIEAGKTVTQ